MQSLAKALCESHEVTLFDCFGGGAYRAPEDGRHLPKRGLIHIINNLAADGLCDPLLPTSEHIEDLIKAFRTRLGQAVVNPTTDARLDDTDPLGAHSVVRRLRFTKNVNVLGSLRATDAFQRAWMNESGKMFAQSEAWGRNAKHEDGNGQSGERLVCNSDFLRKVLAAKKQDLLALIILRVYQEGIGGRESQFWHTTAVVHIKQSLEFAFYLGSNNQLHANRF